MTPVIYYICFEQGGLDKSFSVLYKTRYLGVHAHACSPKASVSYINRSHIVLNISFGITTLGLYLLHNNPLGILGVYRNFITQATDLCNRSNASLTRSGVQGMATHSSPGSSPSATSINDKLCYNTKLMPSREMVH